MGAKAAKRQFEAIVVWTGLWVPEESQAAMLETYKNVLRGCLETRLRGGWPGSDVIPNGFESQFGEPHVDTDHPAAA